MGINQRISLRKFVDDVKRWVDEGRSDEWIASALGTSASSVQSFRSRNGIYRRDVAATLGNPDEYEVYEGVIETGHAGTGVWFDPEVGEGPCWKDRWSHVGKVEIRLSPTKIILLPRSRATGNLGV